MRIVLAKSAAQADQAKKALQSGQSWTAVAKKYSIDPTTKNSGGLLSGVHQDRARTRRCRQPPSRRRSASSSVRSRASSATT